jgi:hypothetical protein
MRTLIYKRTHPGDPDEAGRFGIYDCMGRVRSWDFEAVIGVGGLGPEPRSHGLDGKINWIGIGPHKQSVGRRGPLVTFDHFVLFGAEGPDFERLAPSLAERVYSRNVRAVMWGLSAQEDREVQRILHRARHAPPSKVHGAVRPSLKNC